ncbi:ATP-binding protein [Geofilum rubicundum]|uniref:Uncharacterized protein n=1 Tax=Geofilum rubicundum JCM 15548 TaxID=1236989 RepID=A0A0E9LSH9_9BACT|nr:ATP-binding protein [Geofilum rubicundum]GAO27815.1 hypothetical protein JCM15548_14670 [Geofilum rubicundum JCM 15548]
MFDIKSPATFLEYFSFLKDAYLLEFIPIFSHSLKVQARNPKKVYVMDMGLYTETSLSTSDNMGRRLENLGLNEGTIVTLNQKDTFEKDGLTIRMVPAHDFFENNPVSAR